MSIEHTPEDKINRSRSVDIELPKSTRLAYRQFLLEHRNGLGGGFQGLFDVVEFCRLHPEHAAIIAGLQQDPMPLPDGGDGAGASLKTE